MPLELVVCMSSDHPVPLSVCAHSLNRRHELPPFSIGIVIDGAPGAVTSRGCRRGRGSYCVSFASRIGEKHDDAIPTVLVCPTANPLKAHVRTSGPCNRGTIPIATERPWERALLSGMSVRVNVPTHTLGVRGGPLTEE